MATTPLATLARWDGPSPSVDEWMDGRARILHYGATAGERITVISVASQPVQHLSVNSGIAATSTADAMHAAVAAAVDINFRFSGEEDGMSRHQAKEILAEPEEYLAWQPVELRVDEESVPGFRANVNDAVALYVKAVHHGVFISLATASALQLEGLALNLSVT